MPLDIDDVLTTSGQHTVFSLEMYERWFTKVPWIGRGLPRSSSSLFDLAWGSGAVLLLSGYTAVYPIFG